MNEKKKKLLAKIVVLVICATMVGTTVLFAVQMIV